ncbi:MAG: hypothetical protein CEO19_3 [Parcubacteria group bacterium Gr01-1014_73]|nr:MAG: hypothetical protein CEO19_3 [Parcubacteria group bacterium Gr01-1014_73]
MLRDRRSQSVQSIYWRIIKRAVKRFLLRGFIERDGSYSTEEYSCLWGNVNGGLGGYWRRVVLGWQDGQLILCRGLDFQKAGIQAISRAIRGAAPGSVLELGSGNGFNLLALSVLHPEIKKWQGVEFTKSGIAASEKFKLEPPFDALIYVTELPREEIVRRLSKVRLEFCEGNVLALSFGDRSFDFVFSHLVIEQMPRTYPKAFAEAGRVARHFVCFVEGFREAQKNIFQLIHLKTCDYFRSSVSVVEQAGLKILKFEHLPLNKIGQSAGLLLCAPAKAGKGS